METIESVQRQNPKSTISEKNCCEKTIRNLKTVSKMVNNFVQAISMANDSGSFDTSLEVKQIQPKRVKSKCVTELDREELMRFVREFEKRRQLNQSKTKITSDSALGRDLLHHVTDLQKEIVVSYTEPSPTASDISSKRSRLSSTPESDVSSSEPETIPDNRSRIMSSTPVKDASDSSIEDSSRIQLNLMTPPTDATYMDSDFESMDHEYYEVEELENQEVSNDVTETDEVDDRLNRTIFEAKTPQNQEFPLLVDSETRKSFSFKRPIHQESRLCRAARMLHFFTSSGRKKCKNLPTSSSCNTSRSGSPLSVRSVNFQNYGRLFQRSDETVTDDDGISSTGSRNISPDSSFEMQPPMVPNFKVTPPSSASSMFSSDHSSSSAAHNLAKILRSSQHSKRAAIAPLRRSISDPDRWRLDEETIKDLTAKTDFVKAKCHLTRGLGTAMIRNLDVICSRALPSATSPFRRWGQSSFRTPKSSEPRTPLARRPSSLAASESDVYSKSVDDFVDDLDSYRSQSGDLGGLLHLNDQRRHHQRTIETGIVSAWGNSFEKLLDDAAGLHTFAEFLKKEFSAENIYFWTACERYRQIENDCDRAEQAIQIFAKHLAIGAPEPVNVDSQARNTAEDHLPSADRNLFSQAQKQIFNLMKFDSYQRFIRSELYKRCLEAESKNQPLPYPGEQLDELLRTNLTSPGPSKLKKSLSNAEDRRRKSLLPWHRKVRCKSRDRGESDFPNNNSKSTNKSQLSGNNTLRPPATTGTTTSTSDIHSSRSSLSSFDAAAMGPDDPKIVSLCRVILCDGATTIVQTRPNETVRQLVERLLEKRGIHYQFFDVILNTNSKAIDLENPATMLAGKEVQIEQRVAFKLDLPDPKVISVKSKPKKALCDVLKPILHKYNYRIEDVQVLLRDTQEPLEMNLPVTAIDGQRLQVVMLKQDAWSQDAINQLKARMNPPPAYKNQIGFQSVSNPSSNSVFPQKNSKTSTQQNTLDEITNKVFNELLQGKVDSHSMPKASDQGSLKSEECASESSSIFGRLRRRDSNTPGIRLKPKKLVMPAKSSTAGSEDGLGPCATSQQMPIVDQNGIKKPLIAKWKAGVKLQSTGRTENQEEFLEGLKRAQRARLEDQRGTEINSELPDFLKDKENLSIANKLRKTRPYGGGSSMENGEGQHQHATSDNHPPPAAAKRNSFDSNSQERPQPAPRLSITAKGNGVKNLSPVKVEPNCQDVQIDSPSNSITSTESEFDLLNSKGPPPLPPKPKILPIKPSNWGHSTSNNNISNNNNANSSNNNNNSQLLPSKIPVDISRRHINSSEPTTVGRNVYFDQPSSSFV